MCERTLVQYAYRFYEIYLFGSGGALKLTHRLKEVTPAPAVLSLYSWKHSCFCKLPKRFKYLSIPPNISRFLRHKGRQFLNANRSERVSHSQTQDVDYISAAAYEGQVASIMLHSKSKPSKSIFMEDRHSLRD